MYPCPLEVPPDFEMHVPMQYLPYLVNGTTSFAIGALRANGKYEAIAVCTKLRFLVPRCCQKVKDAAVNG
uniref:Uncharacterized protein n=1 Tax=Ralstonia solanacearum TaxID=305 RepID=A0A0S4VCD9_RALSL|nr:protein of unknown function [Ralstonia solanacearum]